MKIPTAGKLRDGVNVAASALLLVVAAACGPPSCRTLDLATTTSLRNSGLLDAILPAFTDARVRVHAAGSGRALAMLEDDIVDLALTHSPQAEERYLASHQDATYQKIAFNAFVIVGPLHDPARIGQAADALDAFRRIATEALEFVSRGDESGTHERELELWSAAGVRPAPQHLIVSGNSMATTLRHASERQAYTLTDAATFRQLASQLQLRVLLAGDSRLLNTYAVVYRADNDAAKRFSEWLSRGRGRALLAGYTIGEHRPFIPWPLSCDGSKPKSPLCATGSDLSEPSAP